jgi:exonuclease-1
VLTTIDMLRGHGVLVYMVFDGAALPGKEGTEQDRARARAEHRERGLAALAAGNSELAHTLLSRSIDITPRMAAQLMHVLRDHRPDVKYLVAPYEADAQLAYLSATGAVDAVITEDSDTLPYGCKHVIFKMDARSGLCQTIRLEEVFLTHIPGFDLRTFTQDMLLTMCIASGCDYAASPSNYGIKKAHKHTLRGKTPPKVLKMLRFESLLTMTPAIAPSHTRAAADAAATKAAFKKSGFMGLLEYEWRFYRYVRE